MDVYFAVAQTFDQIKGIWFSNNSLLTTYKQAYEGSTWAEDPKSLIFLYNREPIF